MRIRSQTLAIAVVATISVGFTINLIAGILMYGSLLHKAIMIAAMAGFFVPHYLHIRTALRGQAFRGFPVALLVQAVATYAPSFAFGDMWCYWIAPMVPILMGAVLIRLRFAVALPIVACAMAVHAWVFTTVPPGGNLSNGFYFAITVFVTGFVIYAVTRLVVVTRELERARADLAEAAVLKERLRISRDLHDGLGHSLSAIALKGDLARRLIERDPAMASGELDELVRVARDAAQDVRQVARGFREMSLTQEVNRGVALLEASGVECHVNLAEIDLPKAVVETLAWGVREGITNVVRHSRATTCSITTSRRGRTVRLEVVNDGAPGRDGDGSDSGLAGLRERAGQAGGSLIAERTGDSGFRLAMEIPVVVPASGSESALPGETSRTEVSRRSRPGASGLAKPGLPGHSGPGASELSEPGISGLSGPEVSP
ncbi:sensor histidine kinase [Microtetraspora sp. NBRC 16547]|uniref:sensor histidine kinase n=1 Tax=Microtetraspora sp. NBRC 16547 TaxID=3030993 RepID=UPI0024A4A0DF|nr:sensor histidine kinase [Microtetraspora sp. NBRC 16547]GLX00362.1 two-component sensor histidine kinase [Microtetraspora sp. NBRC 16547]